MTTMIALVIGSLMLLGSGCVEAGHRPEPVSPPETRQRLVLPLNAKREARAVMRQHLESVQQIVAALGREDYVMAQQLTETHLGFFMHRQAMQKQRPEDFPPAYHDLAMAHHEAAEDLARTIPSRDLKQILPKLDAVLKACVACHNAYRL